MVEAIADVDEPTMEQFLESGSESFSIDFLVEAIRRVTIQSKGVAVLCGSSLKNKGVQPLLDAVARLVMRPVPSALRAAEYFGRPSAATRAPAPSVRHTQPVLPPQQ